MRSVISFFLKNFLVVLLGLFMALPAWSLEITALRSWRAPDNTRLVLDLSDSAVYRLSPESSPARLIVELDDATVASTFKLPPVVAPLKSLRLEAKDTKQLLVIDLLSEVTPKLFHLPPNEKYSHRLVIDLFDKAALAVAVDAGTVKTMPVIKPTEPVLLPVQEKAVIIVAPPKEEKVVIKPEPVQVEPQKVVPQEQPYDRKRFRNIIVAIDAGHGGEDPGAVGLKGTHEKNVTLAIARELKALIDDTPGLTAVLTRDGDYFIPLPERRRLARYQHKADIFISIHADAAENRSAKGASVFALSLKGAGTATSRFARMLAERENRSDLIGGAVIERDDILRNVLADMVVDGSLEHSLHMGRYILAGLDSIGHLHSKRVEQAGFAVLKEPGMVSLLVETGFISNPDEEARLIDAGYQKQLAQMILNGVRYYCQQYPAPESYFAWQAAQGKADVAMTLSVPVKQYSESARLEPPAPLVLNKKPLRASKKIHRVRSGENLTELAAKYNVSIKELREENKLKNDNVRIGQVLKIPAK